MDGVLYGLWLAWELMSNSIIIRKARYRDAKSIFDIHLKSLGGLDEEDYEWFAGLLKIRSRRRKVLVAEIDNVVAGFIIAYKYRKRAYIDSLAVDPKFRSMGIGSMLLNAMEDLLKKCGVKTVALSVKRDNYSALGFYIKHKYIVNGVVLLLSSNRDKIVSNGLHGYRVVVRKGFTGNLKTKVLPSTWWSSVTEYVDKKIYRLYGEYTLEVYRRGKLRGLATYQPEKDMTIDYLAVSYHKPTEALSALLSALKNEAFSKGIEWITIPVDATKNALIRKLMEHGFRIEDAEYKLVKEL